jgi:hypothetical protein
MHRFQSGLCLFVDVLRPQANEVSIVPPGFMITPPTPASP